jgi:hypothetical protein
MGDLHPQCKQALALGLLHEYVMVNLPLCRQPSLLRGTKSKKAHTVVHSRSPTAPAVISTNKLIVGQVDLNKIIN